MQRRLSAAALSEAIEAVQRHGGVTAAAKALGVPRPTMQARYDAARSRPVEAAPECTPCVSRAFPDGPDRSGYGDACRAWDAAIGRVHDRYHGPASARPGGARTRILVCSDLHVPFHDPIALARMIEAERGHVDRLVIAGDLSDSCSVSRFQKPDGVRFEDEWGAVTLVLEQLSAAFPVVDVIEGNHDARTERQLLDRLTPDLISAVRIMTGGPLCPLAALCSRFENVTLRRHAAGGGGAIAWCCQIGDAWIGHPERYSIVPGAMLRRLEKWVSDFSEVYSFEGVRLILAGHTHTFCLVPWRAGMLLAELGCLCLSQSYQTAAKFGGMPQRRGYVTFEQDNGRTDLGSVRFHWLDGG